MLLIAITAIKTGSRTIILLKIFLFKGRFRKNLAMSFSTLGLSKKGNEKINEKKLNNSERFDFKPSNKLNPKTIDPVSILIFVFKTA